MKKLILALFFIAFTSLLNAQTVISNQKTSEHIEIAGVNAVIIPPAGFAKSAQFNGFQQNSSGSSIMILEMPAPFSQIIEGFNAAGMKTKGMELVKKENVQINGVQGLLLLIKQFSAAHGYSFLKHTLVLSNGEANTVMINGIFPESVSDDLSEDLKKAVLSVVVEKNKKTDPFESIDFTVDITKSAFKLQNSISGTIMLKSKDGSMMFIAKSVRPVDASDKKGSSLQILKSISAISYKKLLSSREVKMDEADAYQLEAEIDAGGKPGMAIQTILFGPDHYYNITVIGPAITPSVRADYNYVLQSFKRK